jgi:hypothetical protein
MGAVATEQVDQRRLAVGGVLARGFSERGGVASTSSRSSAIWNARPIT